MLFSRCVDTAADNDVGWYGGAIPLLLLLQQPRISPSPSSDVAMLLLQPSDVCANTRLLLLRLMTCVSYRSCVISAWLLPAQPYPVPWCGVGCGGGATYPIIYLLIDLLTGV